MKTTQTTGFSHKLRHLALAAALAATSAGVPAAPALADDWHHDRGRAEWGNHRGYDRDDWRYRGPYVAVTPGYAYDPYYAYPYGYAYAPAPVYASPGVSVVLPIHIR